LGKVGSLYNAGETSTPRGARLVKLYVNVCMLERSPVLGGQGVSGISNGKPRKPGNGKVESGDMLLECPAKSGFRPLRPKPLHLEIKLKN
jgi:hypothetical protein